MWAHDDIYKLEKWASLQQNPRLNIHSGISNILDLNQSTCFAVTSGQWQVSLKIHAYNRLHFPTLQASINSSLEIKPDLSLSMVLNICVSVVLCLYKASISVVTAVPRFSRVIESNVDRYTTYSNTECVASFLSDPCHKLANIHSIFWSVSLPDFTYHG